MTMKTLQHRYFDPEAPGARGIVGIVGLVLLLIARRAFSYVQPYVMPRWRVVRDLHPRIKALASVMISLVVLLALALFALISLTGDEPASATAPSFSQALAAPYGIDRRSFPATDAQINSLLPAAFEGYTPVTDMTVTNTGVYGPLMKCQFDPANPCGLSYIPQSARYMVYGVGGDPMVVVFVSYYLGEQFSDQITLNLMDGARRFGRIGDFVTYGHAATDYFYSYAQGWFSFTYSRGPWVVSVSARSMAALEAAVKAMPL
jgi:hypothetical protein